MGGGVLHQNGRDMPARRIAPPTLSAAQLAQYAGEYYSDELHVLYTVGGKDGKLVVGYPRGDVAFDQMGPDLFAADFPFGRIQFQCKAGGGCTGFTVDDGRVRKLTFTRVTISPAGSAGPAKSAALPAAPAA